MKPRIIINFLWIVLITFTSCDEIKKAYNETMTGKTTLPDNTEEVNNETVEVYNQLIDKYFAELAPVQVENIKEIASRNLEKWHKKEVTLLLQPQKLDEIQADLYRFMDTEEVMLYSTALYVDDNRVRVTAINPKNKEAADWYWYETETCKWSKKEPYKLSKRDLDKIDENVFPLSSLRFSTAHFVFLEGLKRLAGKEGAEMPATVYFFRFPHRKYWNMSLKSDRADYTLEANEEGRITKFEQK